MGALGSRRVVVVVGALCALSLLGACALVTSLDDLGPSTAFDGGDAAAFEASADAPSGPTLVAAGENAPSYIAVDDQFVYWTRDDGSVRVAPIDGGAAATISTLSAGDAFFGLAVDASEVCWLAKADVYCAPRGMPSTVRHVAAPQDLVFDVDGTLAWGITRGLVSDGTTLYALAYLLYRDSDAVAIIPKSGLPDAASPIFNTGQMLEVGGIAADANNVYFVVNLPTPGKSVVGIPKNAGDAAALFVVGGGQADPLNVAVGSGRTFWTNFSSGAIATLAPDGSTPTIASGLASPFDVALDTTHVYWTNFNGATVMGCSLSGCGGAPAVVASGQASPFYVATNGVWVVWTNSGNGTVMKARTL